MSAVSRQPRESGAQGRPRARTADAVSSLTAAGAEGVSSDSAPAGFVGGGERPPALYWTPQRVAEVRRLAGLGWSDAQIAAQFGGRSRGSIKSMRAEYGIPAGRKPGRRVTPGVVSIAAEPLVVDGWAKGLSIAAIAARAGVSAPTVSRVAQKLGLPARRRGRAVDPVKAPKAPKSPKKPKAPKAPLAVAPVVAPVGRAVPLPEPIVAGGVPMIALAAGACRWPIGRDALGRHAFCGADAAEGRPYCAAHHARAVKPRAEQPS